MDRINIRRATTIINGDNQSIIVPNRAFITGDLVNWTLKDKVIRLTIKVNIAPGRQDPDAAADLLLAIARDDPDVLRNPAPSALVEEFGPSSMVLILRAHVPDPSLGGRVKHRVYSQIVSLFREAGISIPLPAQELILKPVGTGPMTMSTSTDAIRYDTAETVPRARRQRPCSTCRSRSKPAIAAWTSETATLRLGSCAPRTQLRGGWASAWAWAVRASRSLRRRSRIALR